MNQILLSVIVPMYNAAPWVHKCLHSLLVPPRLRPLLEVIVVNDGSTDGCEKTAEALAENYPDLFRVIHKANGGHGSAVNAGIDVCRGCYVKVLDADDWFMTEELCGLLEDLGSLDSPDVIFCPFLTFDINSETITEVCPRAGHADASLTAGGQTARRLPLSMEQLAGAWNDLCPVLTFHGILYRSDFYRRFGKRLPEGVFYDDGFYTIVAASHASKICFLDRRLYVYRIGDSAQSVSAENRVRRLGDAKEVILAVGRTMGEARSAAGEEYWRRKTCSFLADYFATCFLRFRDRAAGRREARQFQLLLEKEYPVLEKLVRRKYLLLRAMGYLHISERQFQWFLSVRGLL